MEIKRVFSTVLTTFFITAASSFAFASPEVHEEENNHSHEVSTTEEKEEFNPNEMIMHHVMDAHEWHLWDVTGDDGEVHPTSIPLPIILWDNGLHVFSSSKFEHGTAVVESNGNYYKIHHEKIYKTDAEGTLTMDAEHHPTNEKPLDFSITKNVFSMFLSAALLLFLFLSVAASYKKNPKAPKGLAGFLEPLVVFVRDDIAIPNIGEKKYRKFMGFLLTVFFFIWINNLLGLIPVFPGGANLTGNIAVTVVLSLFTMFIVNLSGNRNYWGHIFDPMGNSMPWAGKGVLYVILLPIEVAGIFIKIAALIIRLFANITAGHIIVLSLISIIFVKESIGWSAISVPMTLFISMLELLVAALQAYIFTMLSAVFIGQATAEHH
ncbi:MAG: ATP synthase F0 subunit A [Crocinitomicaceae bacterium]|nr:ATP synthase F0 subunit A [Crocinitomicaceae bacterium]